MSGTAKEVSWSTNRIPAGGRTKKTRNGTVSGSRSWMKTVIRRPEHGTGSCGKGNWSMRPAGTTPATARPGGRTGRRSAISVCRLKNRSTTAPSQDRERSGSPASMRVRTQGRSKRNLPQASWKKAPGGLRKTGQLGNRTISCGQYRKCSD